MELSDIAAITREEDKIRLYLVSLLGVIETDHPDEPSKKYTMFYHTPDLIEAQSINMAVDIAKAKAEEFWPKAQGWSLRSVSVEPFGPDSIKTLLQLYQVGMIARQIDPPETGVNVNLDATDSQSRILVETDKPAS